MQWPMFERVWQQEQAMHDMMARLGLDPALVARRQGGEAYGVMQAKCIDCVHAGICRAWLDGAQWAPDPRDFCSNWADYVACRSH